MTTIQPAKIGAALVVFANALVALLLAIDAIDWTEEQSAGVFLALNAGIALTVAVLAHFKVGTKTETVAIAGGTSALVTSTLMVFVLFDIIVLSTDALALVGSAVVAMFAIGTSIIAREAVTAATTPPPGG